jgi:hypothetical protein
MPSLFLTATDSSAARKNPGFMTKGQQLKTAVNSSETIRAVLTRFNAYRTPENVIEKVFSDPTCRQPVNLDLKPATDMIIYVA